jgi:plastocyanin
MRRSRAFSGQGKRRHHQYYSYKFDKPGKYPYYCTFHGGKGGHNMAGVVNVTP